ncbi:phosphohydrolase [Candidatus Parcubacteria bacterium]|nr:MAG: phosphohydrolase [Candidatus Parcubacteria bacterium]
MRKLNVEIIKKKAKRYFKNASGCHDWAHVERVHNLAMHIAKKEGADLLVVELATYLHDIGRKREMRSKGKICHAEFGKEEAKKILKYYDIPKDKLNNILHSIISHRYRNDEAPNTLEAKCLYDADKLDSLGAVGIGRIFLFAGSSCGGALYSGKEKEQAKSGEFNDYSMDDTAPLEWERKLKFVKDKMLTKTGREIAVGRHEYMERFFKRFWREVKGKK